MECNKDEALRAKEIAEKKFTAKDIVGAKKFALKAQNLFPSLEGINQMIATLDLYLLSGAISDGEKDWYAVLSVNPSSDDETLRKQYRKLALQFHPDKNKSVGAEGAFKIISEAWSILSDKSKRMQYDQKRKVFQPMVTPSRKDHSAPNTSNSFYRSCSNTASKVGAQKTNNDMPPPSFSSINSRKPQPSSSAMNSSMRPPSSSAINSGMPPPSSSSSPPLSQQPDSKSFWTSCNRCKMQYEYLRMYKGRNLLCPHCKVPFLAEEVVVLTSRHQTSPHQHQNINFAAKNVNGASTFPLKGSSGLQHAVKQDLYHSSSFQRGPFSQTGGVASSTTSSTSASQAANFYQAYAKVTREQEEAQVGARKVEALQKSQGLKRGPGNLSTGFGGNEHTIPTVSHAKRKRGTSEDAWTNNGGRKTMNTVFDSDKIFKSQINSRKFNIKKGFPHVHIRNILIGKSKNEILKALEKWKSAAAAKSVEENARKNKKLKESATGKVKEEIHENGTTQDKMDELKSDVKKASNKKDLSIDHAADSDNEMVEPVKIDVPDPDFYDFDKDRTERSFASDEIWATYDDEDGMPRYYALIQKVISFEPFKVRMSFLTSRSNSEFGPLNWVASGFAKTSGDFRISRYEVKDELNVFSHKVKWVKGLRGVIKVVPSKGDIWALYRNWSPDWNAQTPDEVIYKYDMVEVLEDYNEEQGVSIAPLVKVAGFKTVFRRHMDPKEVKKIKREEMFRFSHQVPSYVFTGEEGCKAPKGCYELDPAATPLELLQVVAETKDDKDMPAPEDQQEQAVG